MLLIVGFCLDDPLNGFYELNPDFYLELDWLIKLELSTFFIIDVEWMFDEDEDYTAGGGLGCGGLTGGG